MLAAEQESRTEVGDVRFLLGETPDVAVVDKVVALPEGEVIGFCQQAFYLNVHAGAGHGGGLQALEPETPSDAGLYAFCRNDHLGPNFRCAHSIPETFYHADCAVAVGFLAHYVTYGLGSGKGHQFYAVIFGQMGEQGVELFAVQHESHAGLRDLDVHACRAVDVDAVDDGLDTVFVNRAVAFQV